VERQESFFQPSICFQVSEGCDPFRRRDFLGKVILRRGIGILSLVRETPTSFSMIPCAVEIERIEQVGKT